MSTNENTTSVADALAAAELTAPRAAGEIPLACTPSLSAEIHWIEPDKLHLNPLSDNIYGSDVPAALLASIRENDIQSPLVIAKTSMRVISGNTRLRIALQLFMEKVPVLFVETDLTGEQEQNLVLSHNVFREKTNEMRAREYRCYLDIEKELARQRVAAGRNGAAKTENFAPSKSREIAAHKVGVSYTSLEAGVKVVETIDQLLERGEFENANRLRKALKDNGYSPAKNLAVSQKWLAEDCAAGNKTRQRAKSAQKPQPVAKLGPVQDDSEIGAALAETVMDATTESAPSIPDDEAATQPSIVGLSAVDAAFQQMDAVTLFLRNIDASQLTAEARARIGTRIGGINAAAIGAGFTIKAV